MSYVPRYGSNVHTLQDYKANNSEDELLTKFQGLAVDLDSEKRISAETSGRLAKAEQNIAALKVTNEYQTAVNLKIQKEAKVLLVSGSAVTTAAIGTTVAVISGAKAPVVATVAVSSAAIGAGIGLTIDHCRQSNASNNGGNS